jgi:preprotein translocase subunit SecF
MALLRLVPHDLKINFVGYRFVTFAISLIIIVGTLITIATKGINYGIDFEGGYIFEVRMAETPNIPELRSKLLALKLGDTSIQEFGKNNDLLIRVERNLKEGENEETAQAKAIALIKETLGTSTEFRRVETVGPKVGSELVTNSLKAVLLALLAMLIYIAIRFEWQFAVCGIVALMHDTIAILGIFSVLPFEFNETAIIAILITAGYSINDTIVIFDRIRENIRKYRKMDLAELVNKSVNETLSRTILTASTTLMALIALYLFGGKVISTFSLPIIIGIIVGSFSSICLASPLLLYLNVKRGEEAPAANKAVSSHP